MLPVVFCCLDIGVKQLWVTPVEEGRRKSVGLSSFEASQVVHQAFLPHKHVEQN